jgi:hypothetical protein
MDLGVGLTRSRRRVRVVGTGLIAACSLLALAAHPASVTAASAPPFDPPTALPSSAGSIDPSLIVDPDGPVGILASTAAGQGCTLFTVSHSGGSAEYLGRLAGGTGCEMTSTEVQGQPQLAYSAAEWQVPVSGQSTTGGASFSWATASAPAMGSLAADPALDASATTDLFELVTDPATGLPHVAVSTDGGRSFSMGSALIDPVQVPAALWSGSGPAPVVGNLIARRNATGLTLYTAFETAASAADRSAQAAAGTDNLSRLYEAVGTVIPGLGGAAPAVSWQDVLVGAAAPGSALNRALPSVAVDAAGHVYDAFSDGHHLWVDESGDGLHWNPPVAVDSVPGAPSGLDAALLPSIAAGGNGGADVAWYVASGGNPAAADPSSDARNTWNVLMAQTLDAGKTWTVTPVTQTALHQGALCVAADTTCTAQPGATTYPDSALRIAVDQVTGAAVAAFAGDGPSGALSLLATRQCTGHSALTGTSLTDDCVALQPATPVLPGTSCPGPQITNPAGQAIRTIAPAGGVNLPALDLLSVRLGPQDSGDDIATIAVNEMTPALPGGVDAAIWRVLWTMGGHQQFAEASLVRGGSMEFAVGALNSDGSVAHEVPAQGTVAYGAGGGVAIVIPRSAIGNPATGTQLKDLYAATYAQYRDSPASLGELLVDRAPEGGYGATYELGVECPPADNLPDAPAAVMLPLVGGIAAILVTAYRRRRSRRTVHQPEES